MKFKYLALLMVGLGLLSACRVSRISAPSPTLKVSLSAGSSSATVNEGATTTSFTVTATSTGSARTPIVVDLAFDKALFSSVTATAGATAGTYTITATTLPDIGAGTYTTLITLRLCQEAACAKVYAGSTVTYTYNFTVKLNDWTTFQRNVAHTGYVHTTLDVTKFAKAWTWADPDGSSTHSSVISVGGRAFFTSSKDKVYALNESDGTLAWAMTPATPRPMVGLGDPAIDNGTLFVPGIEITGAVLAPPPGAIRALDAATGAEKADFSFTNFVRGGRWWTMFSSPTVQGGDMFYAQANFPIWQSQPTGAVLKFASSSSGVNAPAWTSASVDSAFQRGEAIAVDQTYAYYSTGSGVLIFNRSDGSLAASVVDTSPNTGHVGGPTAAVITSSGHVIYYDNSTNPQFVAVNPAARNFAWRSNPVNYLSVQPAAAGGMIYAALSSGGIVKLTALSDVDGSLQWSWTLPFSDTTIIGNIVVCDNLVLISSDKTVYAIDLATHQTVWTYPAYGRLSISSSYILYIVPDENSSGTALPLSAPDVTAIKLR